MLGVSNSNATMKFVQLCYFSSQNIGGTKDIMSPPVQKLRDTCPPSPLKLDSCVHYSKIM